MPIEYGIRIKQIREIRNYTQCYMANQLNISQNMYSKLENGLTPITTIRLEMIAKVLMVSVEKIVDNDSWIFNLNDDNNEKVQINDGYAEPKGPYSIHHFIKHLQEENNN